MAKEEDEQKVENQEFIETQCPICSNKFGTMYFDILPKDSDRDIKKKAQDFFKKAIKNRAQYCETCKKPRAIIPTPEYRAKYDLKG